MDEHTGILITLLDFAEENWAAFCERHGSEEEAEQQVDKLKKSLGLC